MIWHTTTVPSAALRTLLASISASGGVVTTYSPEANGVHVTWTTNSAWL